MSGHSKWSTIKRQKGAADAKRGAIFTKLGNNIAIAARAGPDPDSNFQLRLAIDRARMANMPNENIDRAIQRGSRLGSGPAVEEVVYEGFGPGGAAIIVEAATDNRNRTISELRHLFNEHGGGLGAAGSVGWMFTPKAVVRVSREALGGKSADELTLTLIDSGAEDIVESGEGLTILADPKRLEAIIAALDREHLPRVSARTEMHPNTQHAITDPHIRAQLGALIAALDDHPDVTDYSTNAAP